VKRVAEKLGVSVAEFIQRAVRQALSVKGEKPWMKYAGFVESSDSNTNQLIDEVVYGSKD